MNCTAQPVGDCRNVSAVRTAQLPYLGELTLPCQFTPKSDFFFHRVRRILFLKKKKNGGRILRCEAAPVCDGTSHFCAEKRRFRGQSLPFGTPSVEAEKWGAFRAATPRFYRQSLFIGNSLCGSKEI